MLGLNARLQCQGSMLGLDGLAEAVLMAIGRLDRVIFDLCCSIVLSDCLVAGLHGAAVAITGRRATVLEAAVQSLKSEGIHAIGIQVCPSYQLQ